MDKTSWTDSMLIVKKEIRIQPFTLVSVSKSTIWARSLVQLLDCIHTTENGQDFLDIQ